MATADKKDRGDDRELPWLATTVIIELTDNDIELQVFVDGNGGWKTLEISDPRDRKLFDLTTRFVGDGPVEIIEYQVILDQVDPLRDMPWVDGGTRRALLNLPGTATSLDVPREFLLPNAGYGFEVLAIEASGNSSISVGEFVTAAD